MAANTNVQETRDDTLTSFEDDSVVFVFDRRQGADHPKDIKLGGLFTFDAFQERIREVSLKTIVIL